MSAATGRLIVIESPYKPGAQHPSRSPEWMRELAENIVYAQRAMREALTRGEYPIASHLLYTQPGILQDEVKAERALGIAAGLAWARHAHATVVYTDRGISDGMRAGIADAHAHGRPVEYRSIDVPGRG